MSLTRPWMKFPAFHATAVTPYFLSDPWLLTAVNEIVDISHLPTNWNSYDSPQLTQEAKSNALDLAVRLSCDGLPAPEIAPVAGGGLQFAWTLGPRSLELEVLPSGVIEFLRVYADDHMQEGQIKPEQTDHLRQQAQWLVQHT